jgi:hypothetical protein
MNSQVSEDIVLNLGRKSETARERETEEGERFAYSGEK